MSKLFQQSKVVIPVLAVTVFILAACGGNTPGLAQPAQPAKKSAPVEAPADTAKGAESVKAPAEVTLEMSQVTELGDILTDSSGMTVYTFKNDKPNESTCYDACAKTWQPVLIAKDAKPMLAEGVSGKLGVSKRQDNTYQVTYNDMPLYYYAQDTKAGEAKGQGVNNLWDVVSLKEAAATTAESAKTLPDEWIVAEEDLWLPVIDKLGEHLQLARQHFEAKDYQATAKEIQAAAGFLKDEAARLTDKADQKALNSAAEKLDKLATQVEQGQVSDIAGLNIAFRDAYQTDIDHRLSQLKAEDRLALAEKPTTHFNQAIEAFHNKETQTAANELRKAVAFLKIEAVAATGSAKTNLQTSINDLENLATRMAQGQITSESELNMVLARAQQALASHHFNRLSEAQANQDAVEAGYELKAVVTHLEQAQTLSGDRADAKISKQFDDMRALADELIAGHIPATVEIDQTLNSLTQEIGKLNQELMSQQAEGAPIEVTNEWVVIDDNTWIPVVDNMSRHLQMAHQAFMDGDMKTAAEQIRRSAAFMKSEAANLTDEAGRKAFDTATAALEKLAGQVEQGKLTDIKDLNAALLKVYDTDVAQRWSTISAAQQSPLVEWPVTHLGRATADFEKKDNSAAADEIIKAIAFLRLEEARATDPARAALKSSIEELQQLARNVRAGQVSDSKDLEQTFIRAYQALGHHYYLRASDAVAQKDLKEAGFEIKAAARLLEQTINASEQKPETSETNTLVTDLTALADRLIGGETPQAGEVSQALEHLGRQFEALDQTIQAASAPADATLPTDEWVVAEEDRWIPVVDELGRHLQAARQDFLNGDTTAAAMAIRQGAEFLQHEELGPGSMADMDARGAAAEDLIKLADQVEQGQVTSVAGLDKAFAEAYRIDIEHRWVHLTSQEVYPVAQEPAAYFDQAQTAFEQKDNITAANDIRKAIAFIHLDEVRATGSAKESLKATTGDLAGLAVAVENGQVTSISELENAFVRAHYALATYHQLRATEAQTNENLTEVGYELQVAAHHLEQALIRSGHGMDIASINMIGDLRTLADQLIAGKSPDVAKMSQTLQSFGKALEQLGQDIENTMPNPAN
jgi:predicted lipoprotein with Yx(FWY)xxD motif